MSKNSARSSKVHGVLGEARGRLLTELCGKPQTAVELAKKVGTSSNAVRVHLDGLRSAGLVDFRVDRRGVGKPTHVYALTSEGESVMSSAYAPTLQALLDILRERLDGGFAPLLRHAGTSLAKRVHGSARQPARPSIAAATALLRELGGPVTVEIVGKERVLSNTCCPLAAVTREGPEVCQLMEEALTAASGVTMRERCARGEHPRCAFVVAK
jgi:predicted ArsR family transcriptional regulator